MKHLGIFDKVKKTKNAEWVINRKPTLIDLQDTHMHCTSAAKEFDIFFADIKNVEKKAYTIEIKTNVKKYKLTPRKIRGANDLADNLYSEIVERMSKNK